MPQAEAAQWERVAIHGPGHVTTALLLALLVQAQFASVPGGSAPDLHELLPWLDGLMGDPDEARERRREAAVRDRLDRLAAFSAAQWDKEARDGTAD